MRRHLTGKRKLSEQEKVVARQQRRAELVKLHPGERFFIYIGDETDENGEPLVWAIREDDDPGDADDSSSAA